MSRAIIIVMASTHKVKTDIVVIGAGVVGLAVAERLSRTRPDVVVIERHEGYGREASSRNSQVIHAGIYYPEDSAKARLCVQGNRMMYGFCEKHGIANRRTGKIVPGIDDEEVQQVHYHFALGNTCGAVDLELVTGKRADTYLPDLQFREALLSPSTGIVDAHGVMATLEALATSRGVLCSYNSTVTGIGYDGHNWKTTILDTDGEELIAVSEIVVNSAGLNADRIAETAGFDPDANGCRQMPAKGEYFRVAEKHRDRMGVLVYPAVVPHMVGTPSHGVHLVIELDGNMKIGPNVLPGEDGYSVDPNHLEPFWAQMSRYLPWLVPADLRVESAGVRAVRADCVGDEPNDKDFYIAEESGKGLPGLVNLIAMESPALTSSLAIAEYVESIL